MSPSKCIKFYLIPTITAMAFLDVNMFIKCKTICDYRGGESLPKITYVVDHKGKLNDASLWW
jgi:hypothetical protein